MKRTARGIRLLTLSAQFAAVIAVTAMISIPFFTVSFTLQTMGIFLALFILGGRGGSISVGVYVALGLIGLPVFSGFSGGVSRLFEPTGGFIAGFVLSALVYWLGEKLIPGFRHYELVLGAISLSVLYLSGALWYAVIWGQGGFWEAALVCVLPFIIPDTLKIGAAYAVALAVRGRIKLNY